MLLVIYVDVMENWTTNYCLVLLKIHVSGPDVYSTASSANEEKGN